MCHLPGLDVTGRGAAKASRCTSSNTLTQNPHAVHLLTAYVYLFLLMASSKRTLSSRTFFLLFFTFFFLKKKRSLKSSSTVSSIRDLPRIRCSTRADPRGGGGGGKNTLAPRIRYLGLCISSDLGAMPQGGNCKRWPNSGQERFLGKK